MASVDIGEQEKECPWQYMSQSSDHPLIKDLFDRHHEYPDTPAKFTVGLVLSVGSKVPSDFTTEPVEIEIGIQELTLSGKSVRIDCVRYAVPHVIDNTLSLLISVRTSSENSYSVFYTVKPVDGYEAVSILNLIRKSMFSKILQDAHCDSELAIKAMNFNRLLFSENLECSVTPQPDGKEFYVRIDQECMCFYHNQFESVPCVELFFWKERGSNVIERVMMINDTGEIRFESENTTVLVKDQRNIDKFKSVIASNSSKSKEIFQDYSSLVRFLGGQPGIQKIDLPGPSRLNELQGKREDISNQYGQRRYISGNEFEEMIDSMMSAEDKCRNTDLYESISLQWIVIQDEIIEILNSGLVPPCDFLSGGLDPDDPTHFRKCLEDLEEKMMKDQRYDIALSHVQGMKQIFAACTSSKRLHLLLKNNDLDLLKMVYFRSWSGSSMDT
ncbi:uncharacterized protein LOC133188477 [Saccostrea echinata]|uniref:uncharacterized protein LOC133188477 n=1 Tax=Saccostrea echinata TaxID=191078 RepID=UPI002A828553|nr:uncharacterized protein LOC133188477 [Saccostrea echinata]